MKRWSTGIVCFTWAALLTACGGGGDDGEAERVLRVSVTSAPTLEAEMYTGYAAFPDIEVRFDFNGDLGRMVGRNFYVKFEDPGGLFVGPAELTINYSTGKNHRIFVPENWYYNRRRPPGLLQAAVKLQVCYDPACAEPVAGNSTITLPYSLRIRQGAAVDVSASPVKVPFGETPPQVFVPFRIPEGVTVQGIDPLPFPGRCVIFCTRFYSIWRRTDEVLTGPAAGLKMSLSRPLPIGMYASDIVLNAAGGTASGIQPAGGRGTFSFEVVPNPSVSVLVQPKRFDHVIEDKAVSKMGTFFVLESAGLPVRTQRIEYLPAGPVGNLDAGGQEWVKREIADEDFFAYSASRCEYSLVPPSVLTRKCLPPGRYDAVIHLSFDSQTVTLPITMKIEGAPPPE